MTEIVAALVRANVVATIAILAVLAARLPIRRRFGPEVAYGLWLAPALAVAGSLFPARLSEAAPRAASVLTSQHLSSLLLVVWGIGAGFSVLALCVAQAAFLREAKAGRAGPAAIGLWCPRIIMPPDDGRFTPEERALIRAHEREHIARRDVQARAWMAFFKCVAWCNPFAHLAVHLAGQDQELACDAAVLRQRRSARAVYARALLKTQLTATPLPLGVYWPAQGRHPLETRIALLSRGAINDGATGPLLVVVAVLSAALLAWAAKPPVAPHVRPQVVEQEPPAMSVMLVRY